MKRRAPWLVAVVIGAYAACAEPAPPTVYYEEFETTCEGTPCGWTRTRGEEDQARWIETIHEGDHGLSLVGEVTVYGPPAALSTAAFSSLDLLAAARCDEGSDLRVDLIVMDNVGTTYVATAFADVTSEWGDVPIVTLAWQGTTPALIGSISAISITKTGSGACEISSIIISDRVIEPGC